MAAQDRSSPALTGALMATIGSVPKPRPWKAGEMKDRPVLSGSRKYARSATLRPCASVAGEAAVTTPSRVASSIVRNPG
jgi:hypothetical protein